MTPQPPAPPDRPAPAASLLQTIVAAVLGVRDWSRALMLIVLGLAALLGVLVWQARERLVNATAAFFEEPPKLVLADHATLEATAQALVNPLRPDYGVVIWAVTLELNRRRLLVAAPGDVPWPAELKGALTPGYVAPLFVRQRDANVLLVAVLDGETACGAVPPTYQGRVEFACAAGIPPGPGPLIGLIAALFPQPLGDHEQVTTRIALQDAAERLTVYR